MSSHAFPSHEGKLFIGGIAGQATTDDVQNYFSAFGEIDMCTIKTDVYSGRSRGFGFLIFKDVSAVNAVLTKPGGHEICGKKVDPKLATPQTGQDEKNCKVFVGGVDKSTTKEEITAVFNQHGNVLEVFLPADKLTNEPKGFAFVSFDDTNVPDRLVAQGKIEINGKECDVKRANSKNESRGGGRGGFRGGRGGFGGGRGGRGGFGGGYGYDQGGYGGGGGYGASGYDQYGGNSYGSGYQGGYGGQQYGGGGYDQYAQGSYDQSGGYGSSGYGGGYDQSSQSAGGYGGQDQYKMKGGRGRGGGSYTPY